MHVWHFNMIQEYLSQVHEQISQSVLRILLQLMSYREAQDFTGIPLLEAMRETLCEQIF